MGHKALLLLVAVGALHDPACGTDTSAGGPNSPCTRTSDCGGGLSCTGGVCVTVDAGPADAGDAGASDANRAD